MNVHSASAVKKKNIAYEFDFEYRWNFSFLHLVEMRELPLRLRKGGGHCVKLFVSALPEVAVAPRARDLVERSNVIIAACVSVFAAWNGAAAGCEEAPK